MTQTISFILSFSLILWTINCLAQTPVSETNLDGFGRVIQFTSGEPIHPGKSANLCIFADSLNYQFLAKPDMKLDIITPNHGISKYETYLHVFRDKGSTAFEAYGENHVQAVSMYDGSKTNCSRAAILGNEKMSPGSAKNITWIDLLATNGRPMEFSDYPRLNTIHYQSRISYSSISPKENDYRGPLFYSVYMGDPFLLSSIYAIPTLTNIYLRPDINHFQQKNSDNISFLDGPPEFQSSSLQSITYDYPAFLPVSYEQYKNISYVSVGQILYPELVQLALVLSSYGKDKDKGNWKDFLSLANDSSKLNIPENGFFESFYKNGQILCRGEYKNKQPHNTWQFWYEDGKICEQRNYSDGKRIGSWFFIDTNGDTLMKYIYSNNQLTYRKDRSIDRIFFNEFDCYANERMIVVEQVSEYKLSWKSTNEVEIDKTISFIDKEEKYPSLENDTLRGFYEVWIFTDNNWEYTSSDFCSIGNEFHNESLNGETGKLPYFYTHTTTQISTNGNLQESWKINLKECFWENSTYSINGPKSELQLLKTIKHNINKKNGNCSP